MIMIEAMKKRCLNPIQQFVNSANKIKGEGEIDEKRPIFMSVRGDVPLQLF